MVKVPKSKILIGFIIFSFLCISSGFVLYSLSDIPFGIIFQIVLYILCLSMTLALVFLAFLCFKSEKRFLTWIGLVSSLMAILVLSLSLILIIDYRMLYFNSIPPEPSKAEWIEDVHYLANQLVTKHPNIYSLVSEEKMTETINEIEEQIPGMRYADILMSLFKIAALPNDGHTFPFIMIPAFDLHSFPFKVYLFPEGLYVVDAGKAEFLLMKRNGEKVALTRPSIKFYQHFLWSGYLPIENETPPVFTNYREDYYNYKFLEDNKTLYIQFNQCMDQPGRETLAEFTAKLEKTIASMDLDRCIVDVRNNDGGSPVWNDLLKMLKTNRTFNQHGHLFVLIGRRTFSSAVVFATRLQLQTSAIFVGEPTGQGYNFYSRPDLIELPHSRLPFSVSRHLTVAGLPFDKRKVINPDIPVEYSVSDFLEGSDPVLKTALTYVPYHKTSGI